MIYQVETQRRYIDTLRIILHENAAQKLLYRGRKLYKLYIKVKRGLENVATYVCNKI